MEAFLKYRRHTRAQKMYAAKRYVDGQLGLRPHVGRKRLARFFCISPLTLHKWIKEYRAKGNKAFPYKFRTVKIVRVPDKRKSNLSPREVALIRYGLEGLTDAQVGALYGRSPAQINRVRTGEVGGPLAQTPIPPKFQSKEQANQWFVQKALKTIEAWMAMLDEIEKQGDAVDLEPMLAEADHESRPQRPKRNRGSVKQRAALLEGSAAARATRARPTPPSGPQPYSLLADLRESEAASRGSLDAQLGTGGAGEGAAGADQPSDGLIVRKRR